MSLIDIIDPRTIIRLWTVHCRDYDGGVFHSFWLKRNALQFAKAQSPRWLFIDLENEWTGRSVRLRDNPENIRPLPRSVHLTFRNVT